MCSFLNTQAQFGYYEQALQFSQTSFGGTARMQGIGGAKVALGGDLSHASSNPAGLGFYNRGSFSITPALNFHKTESDYLRQSNLDKKVNFNIAQLGLSFYFGDGDIATQKIRGSSFAITVDRVNDFYNEIYYEGKNYNNSYINSVIENPNDGFALEALYDIYLINPHPNNYQFALDFGELLGYDTLMNYQGYSSPFQSSRPNQSSSVVTLGSQYAINFAYGVNYMDWFYFGANLSIHSLDYRKTENYMEFQYDYASENGDWIAEDALDNISKLDELSIMGTGAGGNFGIIVRPFSQLIMGLSYVTPIFMILEEESHIIFKSNYFDNYDYVNVSFDFDDLDNDPDTRFIYDVSDLDSFEYQSDDMVSTYNLTIPGRLNFGLSYFFGKNGFLTGAIEFKDYSNIFLNGKDFDLSDDNQVIRELYKSVINYQIGAEYKFGNFQFRGGYGFQEDPYVSSNYDRHIDRYSIGLGYREANFFIDFAFNQRITKNYISPYEIEVNRPVASLTNFQTMALFTLGFNF